jgi:phytanoyl-CoA hydroxylase
MNQEFAYIRKGHVTPGNVRFYRERGYLVAEQLLNTLEVASLKQETTALFRGDRGYVEGLIDAGGISDGEILKQYVAIHFPHKLSPVIHDSLRHPEIVSVLAHIISPNVKAMQSMLFVKGPGKAGQAWHQDEFYIPTRDRSLTGVWIAIDDASTANGCLWLIPGSNKSGYLMKRVPNNCNEYADVDTIDVSAYPEHAMVPVEVKSGSVVFFNGYILHSSRRNKTADCFRMALVNHYMSAESMLPWDQDGHHPPTEDLRDIVMVAGTDPYAYKGTEDLNKPYLRPEFLKIKSNL